MDIEWWLDASALPSLVWARLRLQMGEPPDVLVCDNRLLLFETRAEAERWLAEEEYVPLKELVARSALPEDLPTPEGRTYQELIARMKGAPPAR